MANDDGRAPHPSAAGGTDVMLDGKDLPAFCPNPKMTLWNQHPRVFLDVVPTGHAMCPYCGTQYRLKPGAVVPAH